MIKIKSAGNAKSARAAIPVTDTPEIIVTKKRGRPVTGKAMTTAQRQAKFKALKRESMLRAMDMLATGRNQS